MILTNRLFEREQPSREAKSIYIFCEGAKREYQYFSYFKAVDSRINIEVYKLDSCEDNSPLGLLKIARTCVIVSEENPDPKYSFQENDEVWIVLDTDDDETTSRKYQIDQVREFCSQTTSWFVAQSNPCFEVWLYYHFYSNRPVFEGIANCVNWKNFVNESIRGGFDSRRHPIYIERASKNAEENFELHENTPCIGSTEVFNLARAILSLVKTKIELVLEKLNEKG